MLPLLLAAAAKPAGGNLPFLPQRRVPSKDGLSPEILSRLVLSRSREIRLMFSTKSTYLHADGLFLKYRCNPLALGQQ